jgi:hypothetical protein
MSKTKIDFECFDGDKWKKLSSNNYDPLKTTTSLGDL